MTLLYIYRHVMEKVPADSEIIISSRTLQGIGKVKSQVGRVVPEDQENVGRVVPEDQENVGHSGGLEGY